MSYEHLHKAKKKKDDNYFTRLEDIEAEILNTPEYKEKFIDKTIYMNCDNPEYSNFWKFFKENFKALNLKKIISTYYIEGTQTYKTEYDGETETKTLLKGDGDMFSDECIDILKSCDMLITNPPFSRFREILNQCEINNKKYLLVGNLCALGYKAVFDLFKENKIMTGKTNISAFHTPTEETKAVSCRWYTNIPDNKIKSGEKGQYVPVKYDDYDALNYDKLKDIPLDFDGVIGVPITILENYNSNQFELIDLIYPHINGQKLYVRILIKKRKPEEDNTSGS